MSAHDENYDAAPLRQRPAEPKLRLRWFPGRYSIEHAEAGDLRLSVGWGTVQPKAGPDAWDLRADGISWTFHGTSAAAKAHLETLVRDRLIKALAAFGEQERGE